MPKTDPLAQLKDIHLPAPVSWWPLAPGWYVVLTLVLILMGLLARGLYKQQRNARAKKHALFLLNRYQEQYLKEQNAPNTSAQISELLRRVALVYYPRDQVAGLSGDEWVKFLNKTGEKIDFNPLKQMLLDAPFKPQEAINLQPLFHQAKQWIKQRRTPCSN